MTATTEPGPRIAALDIVRGVAVMGILAMNIVAFAAPMPLYFNPMALGHPGGLDLATWAFNFVFIEGKMRGLFSLLFGASMLLVVQRAEASGRSPAATHYSRMIWLLLFGLAHVYLIWFGDILTLYAAVGLIAFLFRGLEVRNLVILGCILVVFQLILMGVSAGAFYAAHAAAAAPGAGPEQIAAWEELSRDFAPLSAQALADNLALYQGSWAGLTEYRTTEDVAMPLFGLTFGFFETLGYMLFGMAALKSGFLTGAWAPGRYRRLAILTLAIAIPAYAAMAWFVFSADFAVPAIFAMSFTASTAFRPLMIVGYAALIILLTRGGGALVARVAASGRAAFTNYLGTSLLVTTIFYGHGLALYGTLGRAEAWLVVLAVWALMLLWSKPWLDRFRYGPFEWLWRSLSRMSVQPMRRSAPPVAPAPAAAAAE